MRPIYVRIGPLSEESLDSFIFSSFAPKTCLVACAVLSTPYSGIDECLKGLPTYLSR